MSKFNIFALLAIVTALTAFINQALFKLRGSLGMAVAGAAISFCAFMVGLIWPEVSDKTEAFFTSLNFTDTVFHGMLCFLLFAGGMHVDLRGLYRWKITVATLTTVGVLLSTLVVAFTAYLVSSLIGLDIPWPWLLVFGALISPTDPVSVLALLRDLNAPRDLETKIAGESLLNDGTALALFSVFLAMAQSGQKASVAHVALLFVQSVFGGMLLGAVLGWLGNQLLRRVNDAPTTVVMTLTYALGGYALGEALDVSGALVAAVMGMVVGAGRRKSMDESVQAKLIDFWDMWDELLNMVLFLLVGLALIALPMSLSYVMFGIAAILCALVGRYISVSLPLTLVYKAKHVELPVGTVQTMVWGGVRGGVSLAMVLSLPDFHHKAYLFWATWAVVMFSLLVQAPTMGKVLRHYRLIDPK
ncbi:cation:proton antiporter [Paraburkholderia sp. A3RO-2L]|uniref:cation:proton antiporter n=1 Tax=unclassified Paraburkholderia TaxID=2615204 RepID=UPI003DA9CACA